MEKWKNYRLGDICDVSSSKRIYSSEYCKSGVPFYRGKEIIEKHCVIKLSNNGNELFGKSWNNKNKN